MVIKYPLKSQRGVDTTLEEDFFPLFYIYITWKAVPEF